MWTIVYKGWYIHGKADTDETTVESPDCVLWKQKSLHAAKCFITRQQHSS